MVAGNGVSARNPGIDALRGLCILLVVIHHTWLRIPLQKTGLVAVVPRRILLALGTNVLSSTKN